MQSLTLTEEEIVEATGYRQRCRQLTALKRAGIPADQRPDGSVRVWRHHITGVPAAKPRPAKEHPQLTSDMKTT
ncbi:MULTISPECIES: DUF4224 domain-containing protein [unclassified Paraburkholderia]|uniref:DUF4224 domain-containing protein n=1 Tax=unclassified Paraburkholderia TaxID=2615204 RepID=UPI00160D67AA|nr:MULTISPECIES: DUF4224 domain-containing protein [unclassified Paraburkholderia]MBB5443250.1 hypothetical protein [Paraburkholderia sp. WSM4177]MBB5483144.1 hypothetical protein [Paraburkholderia sp. WSM4180]